MVGGATHQQPQPSQLPPPSSLSSIAPAPTTEEEEFLKRNTDCVYFLASPLTCKKGSECEYRHSDIARVNPRDCWYWLNGNCLNPKCGFRHPPLDGLLGAEVPTPVGPSIPQAPVTPTPPYAMSKQGVACIFFQKGFCLKGHLCPFLHGPPNMVNNKVVQPVQPNSVTKPTKMASAGPEKSIQEPKFMQQESVQNPVEFLPPQGKQVPRMAAAPAPARNGGGGGGGGAMKKNIAPPPEEPPRYRPASVVPPPVMNEFPPSRSNHGVYETHYVSDNDGILNGKDVDEYSREPTPGFDVLVDNELGDSEYYPNEEQFGRSRGHDFDIGRSTDYDVDRDMYSERRDYDHYNDEGYAWEDHRTSSERVLGEASNFGRKRFPRDDSPDQFDKSDLRHRISKQRRGNVGGGLRSVVSSEHLRDSRADRMPRTDSHHHHYHRRLDPGSLSSRLRGRIKVPGRSSSPGNENELMVEREIDMGRQHRSRYSPGRPPHVSSNHSRLRDRIKGRSIEDFNDHKGSHGRREMASDNGNEFSGPKRLSELKSGDDHQSLGKRKYPRVESPQSDGNLSFEGPKPLSEILKRKRGGSVVSCVNNEDNNSNGNNEKGKDIPLETMVHSNKEEPVEKQSGSMDGGDSLNCDVNELEKKAGSADEDAMLDQELEAYDGRDGDYDYEQMDGDGEEYNLEEGEEYLEEDDDDGGKKEKEAYS
ncbi:zinc finger CCCH domain-containing protein 17-like isoform X1 [Cynara cardunculus var. scolymus]|uniref:zinc finger CCCH domain-containing protein 17-like isoform X1 n=1 Tax=Cynara cardunculus var. scolymus TaxID=59895 RepID=UPI000D624B75|nr:zinc finger CCCH domain-containing protein 17-like isoform X1 [Cynara cardunculus var. scolymus]